MDFDELVIKYRYVLKEYNTLYNSLPHHNKSKEDLEILNQQLEDLNNIYTQIYEASKNEKRFFNGATFEVFIIYLEKLEFEQREKSENFSVYDFYKNLYLAQYEHLITIPEEFNSLSGNVKKGFKEVISKRLEYLEMTMYEMGINIKKFRSQEFSHKLNITFENNLERRFKFEQEHPPLKPINNTIEWKGTNVELSELIKALIESNKLEPGVIQSEIFKRFSLFFNYEINETTGIKDFGKRKNTGGNLTKFLDTLKDNLDNWYILKEEKKRNSR